MSNENEFEAFFRDYAATASGDSPEKTATFYAPNFIVAGPTGSAAFPNDAAFTDWLRKTHEFNREVGMQSTEVVSAAQVAVLSVVHSLVTVEWGTRFVKTGERLIVFRISYLLERIQDAWKILAYVTEKDQMAEMSELGLIETHLTPGEAHSSPGIGSPDPV